MTTMNTNIKEYEKAKLTKQEKIALATLVTIGVGFVFAPLVPTLLNKLVIISSGVEISGKIIKFINNSLTLIK